MEVTGAAGTTGVSAARHVTPVCSGASGCARARGYKATPARVQGRRFGPATRRSALVSDSVCVCMCVCELYKKLFQCLPSTLHNLHRQRLFRLPRPPVVSSCVCSFLLITPLSPHATARMLIRSAYLCICPHEATSCGY